MTLEANDPKLFFAPIGSAGIKRIAKPRGTDLETSAVTHGPSPEQCPVRLGAQHLRKRSDSVRSGCAVSAHQHPSESTMSSIARRRTAPGVCSRCPRPSIAPLGRRELAREGLCELWHGRLAGRPSTTRSVATSGATGSGSRPARRRTGTAPTTRYDRCAKTVSPPSHAPQPSCSGVDDQ